MRVRGRIKNGTLFTLLLLGSIAIFTVASWYAITYFPELWHWDLENYRRGRRPPNSIFVIFSLLIGAAAGLSLTDRIHHGKRAAVSGGIPMAVILLASTLLAEVAVRGIQLGYQVPDNPTSIHASLLGMWFFNLVIYIVLLRFFRRH